MKYVLLNKLLELKQLKQKMLVLRLDQQSKTINIYKQIFLENINKLYAKTVICDENNSPSINGP